MLQPVKPVGSPLDAQVMVPPLQLVAIVCEITCVSVHGPSADGATEQGEKPVPDVRIPSVICEPENNGEV